MKWEAPPFVKELNELCDADKANEAAELKAEVLKETLATRGFQIILYLFHELEGQAFQKFMSKDESADYFRGYHACVDEMKRRISMEIKEVDYFQQHDIMEEPLYSQMFSSLGSEQ